MIQLNHIEASETEPHTERYMQRHIHTQTHRYTQIHRDTHTHREK